MDRPAIEAETSRKNRDQISGRATRQNTALSGIARILSEALTCGTEEDLGRACLAVAEEATQSRFGFIGEINRQTGRLDGIAFSAPGWEFYRIPGHSAGGKAPRFNFEVHGIYGRVLEDGKGLFTNDPASHPDSIGTPPGHPTLNAFLGVPLKHGEVTIGMIGLGNREGGYGPEELETAEALAPAVVQAFLRKRAENEMRDSEARFRALFENANDAIIVSDPEGPGRILDVNPAACRLFGYTEEELKRLDRAAILNIADPRVGNLLAQRDETGRAAAELTYSRKDGTRFTGDLTTASFADASGRRRSVAIIRDVTDRKRAEEELRRRAEEVERLLEVAPAAIWVANDPECRTITGNKWANEFYEAASGENVSATTLPEVRRFFSPDGRELAPSELPMQLAAATNRELRDVELHVLTPSGREIIIMGSAVPLRDETGGVRGCIGTFVDISARKRAEAVLDIHRQLLEKIVDRLPAAVLLADGEDLRIRLINPAYQALAAGKEMVGRTLEEVWPEIGPETPAQWRRVLETGEPHTAEDQLFMVRRSPDGPLEPRHFTWSLFRVRFPADGHWGLLNVAWETTEHKRVEEAQRLLLEERGRLLESERSARSEAERANMLKDQFLANLSHELRTPLNAILGWAHILRKGHADGSMVGKGLEVIERNARIQTQLISDLLDVSRIVSGKMRLEILNCDPLEALESAIDSLSPAAAAKKIAIERVLEPLKGPVLADPARLQQAFWNLLSNAIKFTPSGGRVRVETRYVDTHIEIAFRDSGIGISPDFLPHLFERFRQADSSASKSHAGLGLGLAISKHLVELHGGTLRADSPGEGRGSTFTVTLPQGADRAEERQAEPAGGEDTALSEIALNGARVLFVDDKADTREMVKRLLEERGAAVLLADSASRAVGCVRELRPDVLVADIEMPGEDGYEMIRRIRELPPESGGLTPAIAVSASARTEERTHAILAGYQYHLAKPIEASELVAALGMITRRLPKRASSG